MRMVDAVLSSTYLQALHDGADSGKDK